MWYIGVFTSILNIKDLACSAEHFCCTEQEEKTGIRYVTSSDPVSIMDVDYGTHQIATSVPLLPQEVHGSMGFVLLRHKDLGAICAYMINQA